MLLAPFFTTLFLEFGTIVSFGLAFSPKRRRSQLALQRRTVTRGIDPTLLRRPRMNASLQKREAPDGDDTSMKLLRRTR